MQEDNEIELRGLRFMLKSAYETTKDARALAAASGDTDQAARIGGIVTALDDEMQLVTRKLSAPARGAVEAQ